MAKGKSITNASNYTLISGSAGNDFIKSNGYNVTINGGAGNDKITIKSDGSSYSNNTITGGKGNDTIYSSGTSTVGNFYRYAKGDGNDIIYGYKSEDIVLITGGKSTTSTVKNNVLINVGNGTITLIGAKGKDINISPKKFTSGNDKYLNYDSNVKLNALAGNDIIRNYYAFNVTIDGGKGNDTISNFKYHRRQMENFNSMHYSQ